MADEIRFLGDLQRLKPEPGDVYVLSIDHHLTADQVANIRELWGSVMGQTKVLVMDAGMRLGVIAAE